VRYQGIHHASVLVRDIEQSLGFYCGVLGLQIDSRRPALGFPGAWLWVGSQQIHLLELPNPDPVNGRPVHGGRDRHIALTVEDLDPLRELLARAGVPFSVSRSARRALFCRDPDGNALEFMEARRQAPTVPLP
jgi:glyoxylase I family protein